MVYKMTEKKIRVLFIPSWYPTKENPVSGIFIERQATAVSKYCDVAVLHVNLGEENMIDISQDKDYFQVIVYKKRKNKLFNGISYIVGHFQGYNIIQKQFGNLDLLHLHVIYPAGIFIYLLNLFSKKSYVVSEHSSIYLKEDGTFEKSSSLRKFLVRSIASKSKAIILVSSCLKKALEKNKINNTFYIVPNIVEFHGGKHKQKRDRKKKILQISLLNDREKNVSGILEAIKQLSSKRQDFRLDIVGGGVDKQNLEEKAKGYGLLGKTVFFHGIVSPSEVGKYFSESDFLITNSNYETFSVSTAEALAYGKPVISTRCGGPEEFIDKSNGILIDVGDIKALVSAIEYMLDSHGEYDQDKIRGEARDKFSSEVIGKKIFEVYREIIG